MKIRKHASIEASPAHVEDNDGSKLVVPDLAVSVSTLVFRMENNLPLGVKHFNETHIPEGLSFEDACTYVKYARAEVQRLENAKQKLAESQPPETVQEVTEKSTSTQ